MTPSSTVAERPHILIKRRKGRLVAVVRGGRRTWRIAAECLAMMGLSWVIVALGGVAGFYSRQGVFDAQSQRFAEDSMKTILSQQAITASNPRPAPELVVHRKSPSPTQGPDVRTLGSGNTVKGCFGRSRLELFNPTGFVFASYVCEVEAKDGLVVANLGLRRDPDNWKVAALYFGGPTKPTPVTN